MFIINRCFKNIWLESQMIHVALFSFQRTTLSFEARFRLKGFASSDSFIVPHLFQTVRNFFIFLFVWVICSSKALPIKEHFLARPVSRGDLYYITGHAGICQQLFQKNLQKKSRIVKASTAARRRCGIPASISVFQFQSFSCRSDSISTTRRIQSAHITDLPCKPLRRWRYRHRLRRSCSCHAACRDAQDRARWPHLHQSWAQSAKQHSVHERSQPDHQTGSTSPRRRTPRGRFLSWISFCPYSHLILSPPTRQGALPAEPTMPR